MVLILTFCWADIKDGGGGCLRPILASPCVFSCKISFLNLKAAFSPSSPVRPALPLPVPLPPYPLCFLHRVGKSVGASPGKSFNDGSLIIDGPGERRSSQLRGGPAADPAPTTETPAWRKPLGLGRRPARWGAALGAARSPQSGRNQGRVQSCLPGPGFSPFCSVCLLSLFVLKCCLPASPASCWS